MIELIEECFGIPQGKLHYLCLLTTLGRVVIPQGRTEWHLVTDSPTPMASAFWQPHIPEGFNCLASFAVVNEGGRVTIAEIKS